MSEWQVLKLKTLTTKIGSGATPKGGQESYHDSGISLIRSQNVLDFEFSNDGLAFIDRDQAQKLSNVIVEDNDVLVNITGDSVARVCKVPSEVLPARVNQHVSIVRPDDKKVNSDFLLYFLLNPLFKKHLLRLASDGGTRNALTKADLEGLEICIPSLNEQKHIATVLSCLDRAISNLRRQNETLEAIAQTLFKHWFVDFEFPNADGKPYKSSGGEMRSTELGEIPAGWELLELSTVAKNHSETHKFENKTKVIFVNTGDVLEGNFLHRKYSPVEILPGQAKKKIKQDDILYSEIRPINKRFAYVDFSSNLDDYVVSTKFMVIRSNEKISPRLLYLILKRDSTIQEFHYIADSRSGTFPQITFESVSKFPLMLPDIRLQEKLMSVITPLLEKKEFNIQKIQTLAKIRDVLLPKLMSGKLRIADGK